MNFRTPGLILPIACLGFIIAQPSQCAVPYDDAVIHVAEGVVTHVDHAAKEIAIKTSDGAEKTFQTSEHTTVHAASDVKTGSEDATIDSAHGLDKGAHVMVHYTEEGSKDTATKVDTFGKASLRDTKGTVMDVDHGAHTMVVKTDKGTTETYHVADDASVDTGKGVKDFSEDSGRDIEKGSHVTVHYSEKAGRKVVHFVEKL